MHFCNSIPLIKHYDYDALKSLEVRPLKSLKNLKIDDVVLELMRDKLFEFDRYTKIEVLSIDFHLELLQSITPGTMKAIFTNIVSIISL